MIINEKTWAFVRQHADADVRQLALQGSKDGDVDMPMALQQIAGRQTARRKLPSWAACDGIIYPPHLNMEQCSSEQTARYKAVVAGEGSSMADLTGGLGVDFYWVSQHFRQRYYVEQNEELCCIAQENFRLLGHHCSVNCCDTAAFLSQMPHVNLVFMDPARRNEHGGRTYGIEDCSPNVLELLPHLLRKADRILLKLSPMLDWRKAVQDLQYVSEVHIISVDNECKELLLLLSEVPTETLRLVCVNDDQRFEVVVTRGNVHSDSASVACQRAAIPNLDVTGRRLYLYEPHASIMKAGCFADVEKSFAVQQVSANSHLFLSSVEIDHFPGRKFQITSISSLNKQELRSVLKDIEQANVSVRNFPMTAEQLRKKLKLKDGGSVYIFATTMSDGAHRLLICRKIG